MFQGKREFNFNLQNECYFFVAKFAKSCRKLVSIPFVLASRLIPANAVFWLRQPTNEQSDFNRFILLFVELLRKRIKKKKKKWKENKIHSTCLPAASHVVEQSFSKLNSSTNCAKNFCDLGCYNKYNQFSLLAISLHMFYGCVNAAFPQPRTTAPGPTPHSTLQLKAKSFESNANTVCASMSCRRLLWVRSCCWYQNPPQRSSRPSLCRYVRVFSLCVCVCVCGSVVWECASMCHGRISMLHTLCCPWRSPLR